MESFGRNQSHYWPASLCRSALYTERERKSVAQGDRYFARKVKGVGAKRTTTTAERAKVFHGLYTGGGRIYILYSPMG